MQFPLLSSPCHGHGQEQFLSGEVSRRETKSKERGEVKMWKARRREAALPRCPLRGSKAEVDGKFEDSTSCWLRWGKRLNELMKRERSKVLESKGRS